MIVLDDQISNGRVASRIEHWYPGAVVSIRDSRPHGQILDPEIPKLLLEYREPTFLTINYADFYHRQLLHSGYCVVCVKLQQEEHELLPDVLREILSMPDYKTKARRMGKIISWRDSHLKDLSL